MSRCVDGPRGLMNKKNFKPAIEAIKELYFKKYRGEGASEDAEAEEY